MNFKIRKVFVPTNVIFYESNFSFAEVSTSPSQNFPSPNPSLDIFSDLNQNYLNSTVFYLTITNSLTKH